MELEIQVLNIRENGRYAGFSLALNKGCFIRPSIIPQNLRQYLLREVKNCALKPYFYILSLFRLV